MSKVFFIAINDISKLGELVLKSGLAGVIHKDDFTAIKIHFGEQGNIGYIKPQVIKPIVDLVKKQQAKPFLTDASTIYKGKRSDAVNHSLVAAEHGFTIKACGAPVIIADGLRGNSYQNVAVKGKHFSSVKIAQDIYYADSMVCLSHFKGHELSGFGGALKNLGMGCGAKAGKYEMHNSILPDIDPGKCTGCRVCFKWCPVQAISLVNKKAVIDPRKCIGCGDCILSCSFHAVQITWNETYTAVQEKIVEYAAGALANKKNKCLYVNFLNYITAYCDCYPSQPKDKPLIADIGIVASLDPVSIDQASADLVNQAAGRDLFKKVWPSIDWSDQLRHAEWLDLGQREYAIERL
ncbi:MAG: DUF362 domain-containing protein [bacterium]|nr:DUF362 domain-containing protein [bacterium]